MKKFAGLLFLLLVTGAALAQPIAVMSYNIRFDNPGDGVNQWSSRKQKVFDLLKKYDPDIIGVQEALHHQLTDLTATGNYAYSGVGRDDGRNKGEFSAIIYRKERFELLEENTFWLSEQPETPGSKSWDAAITRVASWARFRDKTTGREFIFLNTHFDHIGEEARKQSAVMLKAKASELALEIPLILTGDLNCTRDEEPYQVLTNTELIELIDPASAPEGTYCTFQVGVECRAIDYILLTNEWRADAYRVLKDNDGTHYPSDHLPVMINVSFSE